MRKKTLRLPGLSAPEATETADVPSPEEQIRREELIAAMQAAMPQLQEQHPEAESLEALLDDERGETFLDNMEKTGDLLAAYRLTWYDELIREAEEAAADRAVQAERARYAAASRSAGKEHLRRTKPRGGMSTELTAAVIDAYRLFDPDITPEEIRAYEAQYRKKKQK